ncbi:hypothetical protein EJB05_32956, partial [Eragrostis curvula]
MDTTNVDVNLDRSPDHIDIQPSEDSSFQQDIFYPRYWDSLSPAQDNDLATSSETSGLAKNELGEGLGQYFAQGLQNPRDGPAQ